MNDVAPQGETAETAPLCRIHREHYLLGGGA
jgi:hypothetical protein